MKKTILVYILILFGVVSCKSNKNDNERNDVVGSLFSFPDTIEYVEKGVFYEEHKNVFLQQYEGFPTIVSIIWGDCHVCVHKLIQWSGIISKNSLGDDVKFIFIISTSDKGYFLRTLYEPIDKIPILLIDTNDVFFELNKFKNNPEKNTFLINQDNEIILDGNPLISNAIFEDYKSTLNNL